MIQIKVYGLPAPQGSKTAYRLKTGHVNLVESSRALPPWREAVRHETQQHDGRYETGAVDVRIHFYFPRPKNHYGSRKGVPYVKDSAPAYPVTAGRNDIDKLIRAVFDGIVAGGALLDDGQIAHVEAWKYYATDVFPPGCLIMISECD